MRAPGRGTDVGAATREGHRAGAGAAVHGLYAAGRSGSFVTPQPHGVTARGAGHDHRHVHGDPGVNLDDRYHRKPGGSGDRRERGATRTADRQGVLGGWVAGAATATPQAVRSASMNHRTRRFSRSLGRALTRFGCRPLSLASPCCPGRVASGPVFRSVQRAVHVQGLRHRIAQTFAAR